jgi:hypothetical protein
MGPVRHTIKFSVNHHFPDPRDLCTSGVEIQVLFFSLFVSVTNHLDLKCFLFGIQGRELVLFFIFFFSYFLLSCVDLMCSCFHIEFYSSISSFVFYLLAPYKVPVSLCPKVVSRMSIGLYKCRQESASNGIGGLDYHAAIQIALELCSKADRDVHEQLRTCGRLGHSTSELTVRGRYSNV